MAFLAMGGDDSKKKSIDTQKLISVIKDEFNLTIDIQVQIKIKFSNLKVIFFSL